MKSNWSTKKLREVCEVKKGKKPELFGVQTKTRLPYLEAKFLRGTKEAKFAEKSNKNSVPVAKDDLIIICDGSKSGDVFSGFKGVLSSTMGRIDFDKKQVEKMYLELFLKTKFDLFNSSKKGAAIPHLDFNIFNNLEIPLPPLSEQKKIVARLEELLGKIKEATRLRAEAQEAVQNLLPAELHKVFKEREKKKWEEKELGDVLEKIIGGGTPSKSNPMYWNGKIPWASVKDVKDGEYHLTETRDFITEEGLENSSARLISKGTIIISTRMGLGRVVKTDIDVAINQDLKALFPKKQVDCDFLTWFLVSKAKEIEAAGMGATVSGIRLEYLQKIKIFLPPVTEQKKIVARLDSLSEEIRRLQEYQKSTASDFIFLEQSILSKSMKGELVK